MDRDDYRDKLLDESIRRRELQSNIENSTAQDMISRQVNGGIDQDALSRTLVDGRADDASYVNQQNTSSNNHEFEFNKDSPGSNSALEFTDTSVVEDEEEGALYQNGGNANDSEFNANDRDYQSSYKSPRKRGVEETSTDTAVLGTDYGSDRFGPNIRSRRNNPNNKSKNSSKKDTSSKSRYADKKGETTETVSIRNVKDRDEKRKLEAKTEEASVTATKRVRMEDIPYKSSSDKQPNRSKAREAEAEDAEMYQEAIYQRKRPNDDKLSGDYMQKKKKVRPSRKHKYISAVEEEPAGKFAKKLTDKKIKNKKRSRRYGADAAEGLVMKKVHEGAEDNYGIEASERAIYAARYGKKATAEGSKFAKTATHTVRDTGEVLRSGITTKADLLRQQKQIEAKYKAARRKGQVVKEAMMEVKEVTIKIAHKAQEIIRRNLTLIISISAVLILIVAVSATISSCASALAQGAGTYVGGLSPTTDREMTDTDSYMDELENALQEQIDNIETDYPDYDEYDYDLAEIGHDYTVLMAYLSAEYADYSLSEIEPVLQQLFDEMYTLTITTSIETRTREVYNPSTHQMEEEEYEANILHIKLEKNELEDVVQNHFTDDQSKERYDNYMITGGAHQVYSNPFDFDWSGDVSSPFGWRIHPISKVKKFHNGLDIAEPGGTPIKSVCTGTVISSYYSSSAGNYVIVQDVTGYTVHYMHMTERYVTQGTEIKRGELIGTVGTTGNSTGNHLHIGVKDENGEWLNPSFLVSSFVEP